MSAAFEEFLVVQAQCREALLELGSVPRQPVRIILAPVTDAGDRYGRKALEGVLEDVYTSAADGAGRNNAVSRAAYRVGQLIGGGCLYPDAIDALRSAADRVGLPVREASGTIDRGVKRGLESGWRRPE